MELYNLYFLFKNNNIEDIRYFDYKTGKFEIYKNNNIIVWFNRNIIFQNKNYRVKYSFRSGYATIETMIEVIIDFERRNGKKDNLIFEGIELVDYNVYEIIWKLGN